MSWTLEGRTRVLPSKYGSLRPPSDSCAMGCASSKAIPEDEPVSEPEVVSSLAARDNDNVEAISLEAFASSEHDPQPMGGDIVPTPHKAIAPSLLAEEGRSPDQEPVEVHSEAQSEKGEEEEEEKEHEKKMADLLNSSREQLQNMLAELQSPSKAKGAAVTPAPAQLRPPLSQLKPFEGGLTALPSSSGGLVPPTLSTLSDVNMNRPRAQLDVPTELFTTHAGFDESAEYDSSMSMSELRSPVSISHASHVSRVAVMFNSPDMASKGKLSAPVLMRTRIVEGGDDLDDLTDFVHGAILADASGVHDDSLFLNTSDSPNRPRTSRLGRKNSNKQATPAMRASVSKLDDSVSMDGYKHYGSGDESAGDDSMLLEARQRQRERKAQEALELQRHSERNAVEAWEARNERTKNIVNLKAGFDNDAFRRQREGKENAQDGEDLLGDLLTFERKSSQNRPVMSALDSIDDEFMNEILNEGI